MFRRYLALSLFFGGLLGTSPGPASDLLPDNWDISSGDNVKWVVELGSYSYGGPVVAAGKVFVGTNNARPRDPASTEDLGILMAFDAADGAFLWQASHAKLDLELDYPDQGVCSTPTVEGDRLYYLSNRGELLSLDTEGFRDGVNDGPWQDEIRTDERSADVVWSLDLRGRLGVVPHYMSASSPAISGDLLFVLTSNGADDAGAIAAPGAPSFVAVRKETGEVVWQDSSASPRLIDGQWSSPTVAFLGGRSQVLFGGGDGWLYSFDPPSGELLWSFDGNASAGVEVDRGGDPNVFVATPLVVGERIFLGMGRDPEVGSAPGSLWALEGDPQDDLKTPSVAWHLGGQHSGRQRPGAYDFGRTIATVTVADGVLYAADLDGFVFAIDPEDGRIHWRYDALAPVWASPVVLDGRLYVVDTDGEVTVMSAGKEMVVHREIDMGAPIYRAPVATEDVLFVMTSDRLFALSENAGPDGS